MKKGCVFRLVLLFLLCAFNAKANRNLPQDEHLSRFSVYVYDQKYQEQKLNRWTAEARKRIYKWTPQSSPVVGATLNNADYPNYEQLKELKRLKKTILRPTNEGQMEKKDLEGIMMMAEDSNDEVFVPKELIRSTNEILTRIPQTLKRLKVINKSGVKRTQSVNNSRKMPIRRHVTGRVMRGMPFSFQYIIDDEETKNYQTRQEEGDAQGVVRGCYQVLEPTELVRTVTYRADSRGFMVLSTNLNHDKIPCKAPDFSRKPSPFEKLFNRSLRGPPLELNSDSGTLPFISLMNKDVQSQNCRLSPKTSRVGKDKTLQHGKSQKSLNTRLTLSTSTFDRPMEWSPQVQNIHNNRHSVEKNIKQINALRRNRPSFHGLLRLQKESEHYLRPPYVINKQKLRANNEGQPYDYVDKEFRGDNIKQFHNSARMEVEKSNIRQPYDKKHLTAFHNKNNDKLQEDTTRFLHNIKHKSFEGYNIKKDLHDEVIEKLQEDNRLQLNMEQKMLQEKNIREFHDLNLKNLRGSNVRPSHDEKQFQFDTNVQGDTYNIDHKNFQDLSAFVFNTNIKTNLPKLGSNKDKRIQKKLTSYQEPPKSVSENHEHQRRVFGNFDRKNVRENNELVSKILNDPEYENSDINKYLDHHSRQYDLNLYQSQNKNYSKPYLHTNHEINPDHRSDVHHDSNQYNSVNENYVLKTKSTHNFRQFKPTLHADSEHRSDVDDLNQYESIVGKNNEEQRKIVNNYNVTESKHGELNNTNLHLALQSDTPDTFQRFIFKDDLASKINMHQLNSGFKPIFNLHNEYKSTEKKNLKINLLKGNNETSQNVADTDTDEWMTNYLNNLRDMLLNSFRNITANKTAENNSNFINFPFVLLPITSFLELREKGFIDQEVQGFGAVILPMKNGKNSSLFNSPEGAQKYVTNGTKKLTDIRNQVESRNYPLSNFQELEQEGSAHNTQVARLARGFSTTSSNPSLLFSRKEEMKYKNTFHEPSVTYGNEDTISSAPHFTQSNRFPSASVERINFPVHPPGKLKNFYLARRRRIQNPNLPTNEFSKSQETKYISTQNNFESQKISLTKIV